ncbi:nuclear transport factor 2 family protein [Novosphingobium sp. 9U]|uniref:nuclear transport factor 2 family protein n=1 Tax=Novosphingobium sp. 9U TaxID=2653158 RepID=UPI0012F24177|nr:nuclear transport factor 2 family protein [Novosphingobium sp. 9U]VWX50120.1 hypothetical protein NOVOSPHI9U_260175 [Novosphingobium sp. 9U]
MDNDSDAGFRLAVDLASQNGMDETARANRASLLEAYQDIAEGKMERFMALLHPSVSLHQAPSLPYAMDTKGLDETLAGFEQVMVAWAKMHVTITELTAAGDLVVACMQVSARSAATGAPYEAPCTEVFRFHDGQIFDWRPLYWDTHAVRNAFGLPATTQGAPA